MNLKDIVKQRPITAGVVIFSIVVLSCGVVAGIAGVIDLNFLDNIASLSLLPLLIGVTAITITIWLPIWITRAPPKTAKPKEPVELLLADPHVKRTIMRLNIGGTLAAVTALMFAIWGLYQANYQSRLAETALQDQKISSAWQILAQSGATSAGKVYALNILANETEEVLVGLDLSCSDYVDDVDERTLLPNEFILNREGCRTPTQIANRSFGSNERNELEIRSSTFNTTDFNSVSFENATFNYVDFSNADATDLSFNNTQMWEVNFSNSYLDDALFNYVALVGPNFSNSHLDNTRFYGSSLFYVDFSNMNNAEITISNSALYQADFTSFNFSMDLLKFEGDVIFDPNPDTPYELTFEINFIDGAYGTEKAMFNISDATFCHISVDNGWYNLDDETWSSIGKAGEKMCWSDVSQEFLDHTFYWSAMPPKGLDLLPFDAKVRAGCEKPSNAEMQDAGGQFIVVENGCIQQELVPVSKLLKDGALTITIE